MMDKAAGSGGSEDLRQRLLTAALDLLQEPETPLDLRKVAERIRVEPSYLSKVERNEVAPPSHDTIKRLAEVLEEDADILLALAGKVSEDLREAIIRRPRLFAELIRKTKDLPDRAVLRLVREVRDGEW